MSDFHRHAPEWRLEVQVMPFEKAADYRLNPFDLTKAWPQADYPPITAGRMILDRKAGTSSVRFERSSFDPSNLVPGTGTDRMLVGHIFSYHDTHLHRVGANHQQSQINAPKSPVHSCNKEGAMRYGHPGNRPAYAPNSRGSPGRGGRQRLLQNVSSGCE